MDPMDIDMEVPDTPERLTTRVTNGESGVRRKHYSPPTSYQLEQRNYFEGCSKDKPIYISSGSKKPPQRLPKPINSMQQTAFSLDTSPPLRNHPLFRKGGVPGNSRVELKKKSGLVNGASGCGNTAGLEFVTNIKNKPGNDGGFLSRDSIASPLNKQKRLVRNGCISPYNIAKGKQLMKDTSCSLPSGDNSDLMVSNSPSASVNISDLVAEVGDSRRRKGKGILTQPCSYREPVHPSKNFRIIRSSVGCDEKDVGKGYYIYGEDKSIEESAGWRTTHNRSREMDVLPFNVVRETVESNQYLEDRAVRKGKGLDHFVGNDYSEDPKLISSVNVCPKELVPHSKAPLEQHNKHSSSTSTHVKRKKQGSTSNNVGECSSLGSDGHGVTVLDSTAQAADPRSTTICMNHLQPIVEIDEFSPQSNYNARDEEAKARQVEADELLARELQEQFYNEAPVQGIGEVDDEYLALALQHHDVSDQVSPPPRHSRARGSFVSEMRRQSQSLTASSAPRRGSLARASTLGRMTRIRSRFPGQPRSLLSSREGTSMFPADMDIDLRMHILGALEEFSDMGLTTEMLNTQRDFTEDDYEMLLALDENNSVHRGASNSQINGLPQSTVQSDNFEETCAICLETPAIGDTIRHLPCMHKFHKDCIDPWLRRKTSCPVCKSSIT